MKHLKLVLLSILFISMLSYVACAANIVEKGLETLKNRLVRELSQLLGREIIIGKIRGTLLYEAELHDVIIAKGKTLAEGKAFFAKKVTITYNPIKMAIGKDVLPGIIKIDLEEPDLYIERTAKGKWISLGLFLGPPPDESKSAEIPFAPKITIDKGSVTFIDKHGFGDKPLPKPFQTSIKGLRGFVDLRKSPDVDLALKGYFADNKSSSFNAKGNINIATGNYRLLTNLKSIPLRGWASYLLTTEDFKIDSGLMNSTLTISGPPKAKGKLPVVLEGNINLVSVSGKALGYPVKGVNGDIYIKEEDLKLKNLKGILAGVTTKANGSITAYKKIDLKLNLFSDLSSLPQFIPELKEAKPKGKGFGSVTLKGEIEKPEISGYMKVSKGSVYDQNFDGEASIKFKDDFLALDVKRLDIYDGKTYGKCEINFKGKIPSIDLDASAEEIDLYQLSQKTAETMGKVSGSISAHGSFEDLAIQSKAKFTQASVLGQPVEEASAKLRVLKGKTTLEELLISSEKAELKVKGSVEKDLAFTLEGESKGIELKGQSFLGEMGCKVEYFAGKVSGSLKDILTHPLSSLRASGNAHIIEGFVGEQTISEAKGEISIGEGMIKVTELRLSSGHSILDLSGKIGLGAPTNLKVSGTRVNLSDLKILNMLLPEEAGKLEGVADLDITIYGYLPKETVLDSIDPLLDLSAKGTLSIKDGVIGGEKVTIVEAAALWDKREFLFDKFYFKTEESEINLSGSANEKGELDLDISGNINLEDIKAFTEKYGNIRGRVSLASKVSGKLPLPDLIIDFDAEDLQFNKIHLIRLNGKLSFKERTLSFIKPLTLFQKEDEYTLSGKVRFEEKEPPLFNLKFKAKKGTLQTFITLARNILTEFKKKQLAPGEETKTDIDLAKLSLPNVLSYKSDDVLLLYKADGEEKDLPPFFLRAFGKIIDEIVVHKEEEIPKYIKNVEGTFTGALKLSGKGKDLKVALNVKINSGMWEGYTFEELEASLNSIGERITVSSLSLKKKGGKIEAKGNIDLKDKLKLKVYATDFPIDFLSRFFPDKTFEGELNMKGSINGTLASPEATFVYNVDRAKASGLSLDKIKGQISLKDSLLSISSEAEAKGEKSFLYGDIPLNGEEKLNVIASLYGEGVGLFTLPISWIQHIRGDGRIYLKASGTRDNPNINGIINLANTSFHIFPINSKIENLKADIRIKNSLAQILNFNGIWRGEFTSWKKNKIDMKGNVSLEEALKVDGYMDVALKLKDSTYYLNAKGIYKGEAKAQDITLEGPIYFTEKEVPKIPKLRGRIYLSDGTIPLPKGDGKKKALPHISLDLTATFIKNIYIVGGDAENIISSDFSNLILNLEATAEDIKITETLSEPKFIGEMFFKRGDIVILDRQFRLLSEEEQKRFYLTPDRIKPNLAVFKGGPGREGAIPHLTLTSMVKIKHYEAKEGEEKSKPKHVLIIARISGMPFITEVERGIKISFDAYDTDETGAKVTPGIYSDEEIKTMLLPEYVKASVGITEREFGASEVVADYLNSRLQLLLLRGVERELEKSLGLESLTLEYNFGRDLKRLLPRGEVPEEIEEEETFAVSFAKRVFERFYIDVRYAQAMEERAGETRTYFNYQLTYKLGRIWSIIYYREPFATVERDYPYYKLTLKGEYNF